MGLFRKGAPPRTQFYDPDLEAMRDPAVREWLSRLGGRLNQLEQHVALVANQLGEIRERLVWTLPREGSPFTEGDAVARALAAGEPAPERRMTDALERADRAARAAPEA